MKQNIPVFVISLARAADRRQAIAHHLEEIGIEFTLMDGTDGQSLDTSYVAGICAENVNIHLGAVGCYLSHLACYEQIVQHRYPVALILEDDARLDPRVKELLVKGADRYDFDYCFLDCDDHNNDGPVFFDQNSALLLGDTFRAYTLSAGPQTLHAYLITLAAATKRLEHAFPIKHAIDVYDQLSYPIHFRAVVTPKAAWVSEHSLTSATSARSQSLNELSFAWLRKWPLFYKVRDMLRMKDFRRNQLVRRLVEDGRLARGREWKALPSGREILVVR